jgi:hypothetical protein
MVKNRMAASTSAESEHRDRDVPQRIVGKDADVWKERRRQLLGRRRGAEQTRQHQDASQRRRYPQLIASASRYP